jgi:uncharacterized membrane protein
MDVDVSSDIMIHRSRNQVAAYAMNPDHVPAWYVNIKSVEWKTQPPLRHGSQIAFVADFLGRRLAYTYEIIALVAGERLVMRTSEGPFPMETTYRFESAGNDYTRMTLRNRGRPTGFGRLAAPFMTIAIRRAIVKDLARLKQILEGDIGA